MRLHTLTAATIAGTCTMAFAQAGTLDPSFGTGGVCTLAIGGEFRGVAVQPDGKIVAVGRENATPGTYRWLVQRCLADGSPDTTFGAAGTMLLFPSPNSAVRAYDVAVDGSGRIVVAGTAPHGSHVDMAVVRLQGTDGSIDTSFGSGGVAIVHASTKASNGSEAWGGLALQADGRIVIAGFGTGRRSIDLAVARLTANGALDTTFGGGAGKILDELSPSTDLPWYGCLAVQSDNKILLGASLGSSGSPTESWYVMRYQAGGGLDTAWGTSGRAKGVFAGFSYPRITALAIDVSGRVIAAGRARNDAGTSSFDGFVARYSSNGTLDPTFGSGGFANSGLAGDDQALGTVALQPDGSIMLPVQKDGLAAAERFLATGAIDTAFGSGGVAATAWSGFAWGLQLDGAGHLLVAGLGGAPSIARYLGN